MPGPADTTLLNACRTLFGPDVNLSRDFLDYLQPSGVRSAFRSQAMAHHPDRHAGAPPQVCSRQAERFREVRQAYDLVVDFLERRQRGHAMPANPVSPTPPRPQSAPVRRRPKSSQGPARPHARPATVPAIPLEFGMFCYYLGRISYPQLIEALVWQRRQRPTLGAIARKWGWLSEAGIAEILGHRGHSARFGGKAVELGRLGAHQVEALLRHQQSLQMRLGSYFVAQGWLSEEETDRLAEQLARHNGQVVRRAGR